MEKGRLEKAMRRIVKAHDVDIGRPKYTPCAYWSEDADKEKRICETPEQKAGASGDENTDEDLYMRVDIDFDHDLREEAEEMLKDPKKYGLKRECAERMAAFWLHGRASKKHLKEVRVCGKDEWSSIGIDELRRLAGEKDYNAAKEHLEQEKQVIAALRWHLRGLSMSDSIARVLLDVDVAKTEMMERKRRKGTQNHEPVQISFDELL